MTYSTNWINSINDAILLGTAFPTLPAGLYFELSSTMPDGVGNNVTPPSGGNYARAEIRSAIAASSGGISSNNSVITISASPDSDWGTFGYFAAYDAATSGEFILRGVLQPAITVTTGNPVTLGVGQLQVIGRTPS